MKKSEPESLPEIPVFYDYSFKEIWIRVTKETNYDIRDSSFSATDQSRFLKYPLSATIRDRIIPDLELNLI